MADRALGQSGLSARAALRHAVLDTSRVSGTTHQFYKYPARFSPRFVCSAIEAFSSPGQLVLDPFMGGGTTLVEAAQLGRKAVGVDINSLATFVARVKTTPLTQSQVLALTHWGEKIVPAIRYQDRLISHDTTTPARLTSNLTLPRARPIKKLTSLALASIVQLPDEATRRFARCALLNVGQWALNGQRRTISCSEFRCQLQIRIHAMLRGITEYRRLTGGTRGVRPIIRNGAAEDLAALSPFSRGARADLIVTSPPYPGIHVLYHRWQVDGRKETPAPYWIAGTLDGNGASYYNMGNRKRPDASDYFARIRLAFKAIYEVTRPGAFVIQLVAFNNPERDLPRYLAAMQETGFREWPGSRSPGRLWRTVPGRAWHAHSKGDLPASREVALVHRSV